jgi:hypothetical protein
MSIFGSDNDKEEMDDKFDSTSINQKFVEDKFDKRDEALMEGYQPPSSLKVPEHIKNKFLQDGFKLKWRRFRQGGSGGYDTKNIRKSLHPAEGYSFVRPDELNRDDLIMIGDTEDYADSEVITNGDLVLMKVRTEKAEARRNYYQNRTKENSDAIKAQLKQNAIDSSGSGRVVRTGKNAHFSS